MDWIRRIADDDHADFDQRMVALVLVGHTGDLQDIEIVARALLVTEERIREAGTLAADRLLTRCRDANDKEYRNLPIDSLRLIARRGGTVGREAAVHVIRRHVHGPAVLAQMLESIADEANEVRIEAAHGLADFSQAESVNALLRTTCDGDEGVVEAAVWALGAIRAPEAVPRLIDLLERGVAVRRCMRALSEIGDVAAVEAISRKLGSGDQETRRTAALALGKLPARGSVGSLIPALRDAPVVRHAALTSLGELGAVGVVTIVIPLLNDRDADVRRAAVLTLERLGDPTAIPALLEVSQEDRNAGVTRAAARTLASLGYEHAFHAIAHVAASPEAWRGLSRAAAELPWTDEIVGELFARLKSDDPSLRIGAVWTFGERGYRDAADSIVPLLSAPDAQLQRAAAWSLGRMRATQAVGELMKLCEHPSELVREDVAWALGQCGDAAVLQRLVPMAYDTDNRVSLAAIRAIEALHAPDGAEPLIAIVRDLQADLPRRRAATTSLGALRCGQSVEALTELLMSDEPSLRRAASSALRVQGDPAVVDRLIEALSDEDPTVRETVVVSLAHFPSDATFAAISARVTDPESEVRAAAAAALHRFSTDQALPLLNLAAGDRSPDVRAAAARSMGLMGDPRTLDALENLADDRHRIVQRAGVRALGHVQTAAVHPALIRAMASDDVQLRLAVVAALAEVTHPDADALLGSLAADDDLRVRASSEDVLSGRRDQPS